MNCWEQTALLGQSFLMCTAFALQTVPSFGAQGVLKLDVAPLIALLLTLVHLVSFSKRSRPSSVS